MMRSLALLVLFLGTPLCQALTDTQAGALGYERFTFTDTNRNALLYGVRSQETNSPPAGEQVFYRVVNGDIPPPDNYQTHAPVHRHTP